MALKYKIIVVLSIVVISFAFGRYSAPEKVKIETKTVEVERKKTNEDSDTNVHRHIDTKTVEVVKPDGTKETTTTKSEDDNSNKKSDYSSSDDILKSKDTLKEVEKSRSKLTLSVLAGSKFSFTDIKPEYGGMVSKEFIGPLSLGVFGFSNGFGGLALGVSF